LSLLLTPLLAGVAQAQSSTPLAELSISLWPEYDRPQQVLVLFRAEIAEDVPLPAQVSFTLPATVQALHAVAYLDEAQGTLLNIPEYDFVDSVDGKVLSFSTPSRRFQFEYYSSDLLSINGSARDVSFSFTPSTDVANLMLELQQPTKAQAFTSDPPPSTTDTGQDGLTYAHYQVGAVSAGDPYSLRASYTRSTDNPSAGISVPSSPEQSPVEIGGGGLKDNLGPILIAAGVLLLIGAFGYWFWSQRTIAVPEPTLRQPSLHSQRQPSPRKRRSSPSRSTRRPASEEAPALYCHRCGTKLRDDARFCHACGAGRRTE
jgi:hypothetical protein